MSETITITHYREVTELGLYEAEVDPEHYVEWCEEAGYEAGELVSLEEYLLEGHGDSEYKESVDVCGSDFRDFEHADYAEQLVEAAKAAPADVEEEPRYYWDTESESDGESRPYGDKTARIIDNEAGGVIAYVHEDTASALIETLRAAA